MRVGDLHIELPVLLAPMAAVTDLPFRTVCEEFGLGITITEFLSANAIQAGDNKTTAKMTPSQGGRPFGVQIFGRELEPMTIAARMAVDVGASLVDINMGCPAKRVVAGACGSALMKEPELAAEIVRTVVAAVPASVPVTVKHRAGWDALHRNAPEFAARMVEAGAKMITVHGRTRTQGYSGRSQLDIIAKVRDEVPTHIPVVGNGDVVSLDDYRRMRAETGCDAVMIGRGALGNPWLFRSIRAHLEGDSDAEALGTPDIAERARVFRRHISLILELKGKVRHHPRKQPSKQPSKRARRQGQPDLPAGAEIANPKLLHEVRKACAWYAKGLYGCNGLRQRIWKIRDPREVFEMCLDYFDDLQGQRAA